MTVLAAAVVFLGLLCLLNLLFTLGVIRRLRQHTEQLAALPNHDQAMEPIKLAPGSRVGEFSAITTEGVHVTDASLEQGALVAFLSATCPACAEQLPAFVERLKNYSLPRDLIYVFLVGEEEKLETMKAELSPLAQVAIQPFGGPVSKAFQVAAFPSFILLSAGARIVGASVSPDELPALPEAVAQ
ncbi:MULTISPECIES: TlpA family protein disulfide reductase [Micromonospora]|uniref:TlpA family protein disulfide reductase n=1 Tax=Micromonospora TaxID=1873 RepID=UPI0005C4DA23|nr:hypothetical protein [Micromonospora haikouensis]